MTDAARGLIDPASGRAAEADEELMVRVQRRERAAFRTLVERHGPAILNFIYRFTGDRDWAEDLTQDVFAAVYHRADSYRAGLPFVPWLYSLARHRALDFVRRRRHEPAVLADAPVPRPGPDRTPLEELEREERARLAQKALERLPEDHRLVLVLCEVRGLSYAEAGQILDIPEKTVSSRLTRARQHFREILEEYVRL